MPEPEIQRGVELYLAYFQEAKRLHLDELGRELELYRHTEPLCIEQAFERLIASKRTGTGFIAEILHELAWSQCLGNANHRTTMLSSSTLWKQALVNVKRRKNSRSTQTNGSSGAKP